MQVGVKAQEKVDRMAHTLTELKEVNAGLKQEIKERAVHVAGERSVHEKTVEMQTATLVARNQSIVEEQRQKCLQLAEQLKAAKAALDKAEHALEENKTAMREERKAWTRIKEQELGNLREQYEFWLTKRTDELKTFVTEFEQYVSCCPSSLSLCFVYFVVLSFSPTLHCWSSQRRSDVCIMRARAFDLLVQIQNGEDERAHTRWR